MNATLAIRPAVTRRLTSQLAWPSCAAIVGRRYESSSRRTTRKLRVKPDPSFMLNESSPRQDHIVFNPPSSAPSVYHTPHKFLPKDDLRRTLAASIPSKSDPTPDWLPPPVRKPYTKSYHLKEEDLDEIRKLRTENPTKWTRVKLGEKFRCSPLFVGLVCQASREHQDLQLEKVAAVKARWGKRRTLAREDRTRRRESWGRDEELEEDRTGLDSLGPAYAKAQAALAQLQLEGDGR